MDIFNANRVLQYIATAMVVKVSIQKRSYTWSRLIKTKYLWDLPQKIVWQLIKDRKSLELYYECLK